VIIVIFGALFRGISGSSYFYGLSALQYYVPTIAATSVPGSCYSQLAIVLSTRRQNGILKRVRATPLPAWAYAEAENERLARQARRARQEGRGIA
jgi:ABC-2 type transport system permease protein